MSDVIDEQWLVGLADTFAPDVRRALEWHIEMFRDDVKSPIEMKFLLAFWVPLWLANIDAWFCRTKAEFKKRQSAHSYVLIPQYPWRNYKSDFCLSGKVIKRPILIECDGHHFHERTKEQAIWDRSRDIAAQTDGYAIARFTGSQIHREPGQCCLTVIDLARSMLKQA